MKEEYSEKRRLAWLRKTSDTSVNIYFEHTLCSEGRRLDVVPPVPAPISIAVTRRSEGISKSTISTAATTHSL
eukprot:scaffold190725_cov33-Tisochrysis_lutea.AAC.3